MYNGSAQSVGKIKEFDSPLRDDYISHIVLKFS